MIICDKCYETKIWEVLNGNEGQSYWICWKVGDESKIASLGSEWRLVKMGIEYFTQRGFQE